MSNPDCAVCYEALGDDSHVVCDGRHRFCTPCVTSWVATNKTECPSCRRPMFPEMVEELKTENEGFRLVREGASSMHLYELIHEQFAASEEATLEWEANADDDEDINTLRDEQGFYHCLDTDLTSKEGLTFSALACKLDRPDLVQLVQVFLTGLDEIEALREVDHRGNNAMHQACISGSWTCLKVLDEVYRTTRDRCWHNLLLDVLCATNDEGYTPFHEACLHGHVDCVKVLLGMLDRDPRNLGSCERMAREKVLLPFAHGARIVETPYQLGARLCHPVLEPLLQPLRQMRPSFGDHSVDQRNKVLLRLMTHNDDPPLISPMLPLRQLIGRDADIPYEDEDEDEDEDVDYRRARRGPRPL